MHFNAKTPQLEPHTMPWIGGMQMSKLFGPIQPYGLRPWKYGEVIAYSRNSLITATGAPSFSKKTAYGLLKKHYNILNFASIWTAGRCVV